MEVAVEVQSLKLYLVEEGEVLNYYSE